MNASATTARRRWLWAGAALLALLLAAWVAARLLVGPRAEVGVGYSARVVCACRYVAGRTLDSCLTDLEPGTEIVTVSDDPAARRVTARVPLLARASATADGVHGCRLD